MKNLMIDPELSNKKNPIQFEKTFSENKSKNKSENKSEIENSFYSKFNPKYISELDLISKPIYILSELLDSKSITCAQLMNLFLNQFEKINPEINAIINFNLEKAIEQAEFLDKKWITTPRQHPLEGIPFSLKDSHSTKDFPTVCGFLGLKDYIPLVDSTIVSRLLNVGAILVGKSNVPELCIGHGSENKIFGRTLNPWNKKYTSGGSSAGSAAAVASRIVAFEIGSDLAGSIRTPSHYCGVWSIKPTDHRVPSTGHIPGLPGYSRTSWLMAANGCPVANHPRDLSILLECIQGPDGIDSMVPDLNPFEKSNIGVTLKSNIEMDQIYQFNPEANNYIKNNSVISNKKKSLKLLACRTEFCQDLDAEYAEKWNQFLTKIPNSSVEMTIKKIDNFKEQADMAHEMVQLFFNVVKANSIGQAGTALLNDYFKCLHLREQYIQYWENLFRDYDLIVLPVNQGAATKLDSKDYNFYKMIQYTAIFNFTGHPVVTAPIGFMSETGLPVGLQFVGSKWKDFTLLKDVEELYSQLNY